VPIAPLTHNLIAKCTIPPLDSSLLIEESIIRRENERICDINGGCLRRK